MQMRSITMLALAGAAVLLAGPTHAEVLRFRNGVVLHGEVVESEQTWFKFRRYDTGGVVTLSWEQILEEDRARLRSDLRLDLDTSASGPTIKGVRLYLKSGEAVEGLRDTKKSTEAEIWLSTTAGSFPYRRDTIERSEELPLDILAVLTRPEALAHELQRRTDAGLSNTSAQARFELAEYCMRIAHYTAAKEHLLACRAADAGYEKAAVENLLAQLEVKIAQAEAEQMYADVERLIANKKFADARAAWKALTEKWPEAMVVEQHQAGIDQQIEAAEGKYLEAQVKPRFFTALRLAIQKRAREKYDMIENQREEFSLKAAKNWARKECGKLAADDVAAQLKITADQVKEVLSGLKTYDYLHANYGDGTFIVEKANVNLPNQNQGNALQNLLRGRQQGGQQPQQQPKEELQTPDDWWAKASSSKRVTWLTAYYAEYSGEMSIIRIDSVPCVTCGGKGYQTYLAPGSAEGGTRYKICPRCHGVAHDRKIVYRSGPVG